MAELYFSKEEIAAMEEADARRVPPVKFVMPKPQPPIFLGYTDDGMATFDVPGWR